MFLIRGELRSESGIPDDLARYLGDFPRICNTGFFFNRASQFSYCILRNHKPAMFTLFLESQYKLFFVKIFLSHAIPFCC
jgi:hypothetical protein